MGAIRSVVMLQLRNVRMFPRRFATRYPSKNAKLFMRMNAYQCLKPNVPRLQRSNVAPSQSRNVANSTNSIASRFLGRIVRLSLENLVMMFQTETANQRQGIFAHLFLKSLPKKSPTFSAKDVRRMSANQLL